MNIIHYSKSGEFSTPISQESKDVVIAIDSSLISTHQITLPRMSNAKANKAMPFALEPQLLDDINTLKFFPIKQKNSNTWDVFVITKNILDELNQKLENFNCEAATVLPDFMLLPFNENKITFFESNDTVTFRNDNLQGGSLPLDIFNTLYSNKDQLTNSNFSFDPTNKFSLLDIGNNQSWEVYSQPWKIPAAIAAAVLLFSTIQILINNSTLENQLIQLKSQNEQHFKLLFPNVKRIVNMRVQAEQKIAKSKALKIDYNDDFLNKLSSQANATTRASRVILKQGKLIIETTK